MKRIYSEERQIRKQILALALPLMVSMIVTLFYNIADTYFVAASGNISLIAGVSVCAPLLTVMMALGNLFAQGGSSLVARLLGRNEKAEAGRISSFCFYGALLGGFFLMAVLLIFRGSLLHLLGASRDTMAYASSYSTVLALGAPFIVVSYVHTNLLRTEGMSKEAMIASVGGAVLNVALDPLFIFTFKMGEAGAAVATVLGYALTVVLCLGAVVKKSSFLSVRPADARVAASEIRELTEIGATAALTNIMSCAYSIVLNRFLLPYGTDKIAALGVVSRICMVTSLATAALAFGGQPLMGYLYGAGNRSGMRALLKYVSHLLIGVSSALTAVVFLFAPQFVRMFLSDPEVCEVGVRMLRLTVISSPIAGIIAMLTVLFQASGNVPAAFLLSMSRQGVVFLGVLIVLAAVFGYEGILVSQLVADVISLLMAGVIYDHGFMRTFFGTRSEGRKAARPRYAHART